MGVCVFVVMGLLVFVSNGEGIGIGGKSLVKKCQKKMLVNGSWV